jgi:hypothetical protein
MTSAAFFGVVLALDFLTVVCQPYCVPVPALFGARPLLFPIILAYGALALPFWGALALAFFNGVLWDALTMQIINTSPYLQGHAVAEIPFGWSVILFGILVILIHGLRPLFLRGRWELHCLTSGLCVVVILLMQFALAVFHRGGLVLPLDFWQRLLLPGFFAMLIAPLVYLAFLFVAALLGYTVRLTAEDRRRDRAQDFER